MLYLGVFRSILLSQTLGTNLINLSRFVPRVWLHRTLSIWPMLSNIGLKAVRLWASKMQELGGDYVFQAIKLDVGLLLAYLT